MNYDLLLPLAALPFPKIDPVLVQIGPLAIHWYGAGLHRRHPVRLVVRQAAGRQPRLWPAGQAPMKPEDLDDFLVWAAIGVVAGGRIGYVLFYDLQRYIANPQDIVAVWQGGMSFHGGFLGTTLAMILFARRRGISVWTLFDVVAAGVPVGARPGAHRQFRQFRAVGKADQRSLGVRVPEWRPVPAPSDAALRSRPRRAGAVPGAALAHPSLPASSARPASSAARSSPATGWRASSSNSSASRTSRSAICSAAG